MNTEGSTHTHVL